MAFQDLAKRWFWNWPKEKGGETKVEEDDLPAIVQARKEQREKERRNPCRNQDYSFSDFDNIG